MKLKKIFQLSMVLSLATGAAYAGGMGGGVGAMRAAMSYSPQRFVSSVPAVRVMSWNENGEIVLQGGAFAENPFTGKVDLIQGRFYSGVYEDLEASAPEIYRLLAEKNRYYQISFPSKWMPIGR